MKLENAAEYLNDAARAMVKNQPELIRRIGVTVLGVALRATPPNRGGMAKGYQAKAGRDALLNRIASEIVGEASGTSFKVPTAVPTRSGGVKPGSWQGPEFSYGGYRFVVPRAAGNVAVRYSDPAAVIAKRRFYRRGNVVRARGPQLSGWQPRWVRPGEVEAVVARLRRRAGALASGLLPVARQLKASNVSAFNLSKEPRSGWARLAYENGCTELEMAYDWSGLIVASRFMPQLSSYVNSAARNAVRNTENWYLKQVFG